MNVLIEIMIFNVDSTILLYVLVILILLKLQIIIFLNIIIVLNRFCVQRGAYVCELFLIKKLAGS